MEETHEFIRAKVVENTTLRACANCGTEFELHVPYDEKNAFHQLCDDCILDFPKDVQLPTGSKSRQIEMSDGCEVVDFDA